MKLRISIILLFMVLRGVACQPFPFPSETETPTATTPENSPEPTASLTPSRTSQPTNTPRPSLTPSVTPELFDCLPLAEKLPSPAASIQILYVNENAVWLWDEDSHQKTPVELPADAVGPHLSPDGRYIAFLTRGKEVSRSDKPLEAIPLRILDRWQNTLLEAGEFNTRSTHDRYPLAERVYLQFDWETSPQQAGTVEALKIAVFAEPWGLGTESTIGARYRISLPDGKRIPLTEEATPAAATSPDGRYTISDHPRGLRLFDRQNTREQVIPLAQACPDSEVCYLTGQRSIVGRLD
ncbi:MAG: hypothetical protein N2646_05040 [Bellilinea sp.]|nr:hypothetical protein [Bellilinea sp.]